MLHKIYMTKYFQLFQLTFAKIHLLPMDMIREKVPKILNLAEKILWVLYFTIGISNNTLNLKLAIKHTGK